MERGWEGDGTWKGEVRDLSARIETGVGESEREEVEVRETVGTGDDVRDGKRVRIVE